MELVGFSAEDAAGFGVETELRLPRLSLLFGKNGSGKSLVLEVLASMLTRRAEWVGRRPRFNDESFAYGFLYLRGDWRGDDWDWLRDVLAVDLEPDIAASYDLAESGVRYRSFDDFVGRLSARLAPRPEEDQSLRQVLDALLPAAVVSYQPHASAQIFLAIDARALDDRTRGMLVEHAARFPDGTASPRLLAIAMTTRGFPMLEMLRVLDKWSFAELYLTPPPVLRFDAAPVNSEGVVEAVLDLSYRSNDSSRRWLVARADGRFDVALDVVSTAAAIEESARQYAPPFVTEVGLPRVSIPTPELWATVGRVVVGVQAHDGRFVDSRQLSSGIRRWLDIALVLAAADVAGVLPRRHLLDWSSGIPQRVSIATANGVGIQDLPLRPLSGCIVLIDEPELHLHSLAEQQIADWLEEARLPSGTRIVAATHSAGILNAHYSSAQIVGVTRTEHRTQLRELTGDLLSALAESAGELGGDRISWLQAVRGALFAEGEHDINVLRRFFGREIQEHRITLIPLRGHKNLVDGTIILDFLGSFGFPIRVLLDDVDTAVLRGASPRGPTTSETKLAYQITQNLLKHPNIQALAYTEPDIWCALPVSAVTRAFPSVPKFSWAALAADWRSLQQPRGFKSYVLGRLNLRVDPDVFLETVLAVSLEDEQASPALLAVMQEVFADIS